MNRRWERILDSKPVTLVDQLMTEAAKTLWSELGSWPPPIQELELAGARSHGDVLKPDSPVPPRAAFREAIKLARWDLEREFDAFDEYVRNRRWEAAGLAESHKPALLFLTAYLTESLLALREATEGRVKRGDLLVALERLDKFYEVAS